MFPAAAFFLTLPLICCDKYLLMNFCRWQNKQTFMFLWSWFKTLEFSMIVTWKSNASILAFPFDTLCVQQFHYLWMKICPSLRVSVCNHSPFPGQMEHSGLLWDILQICAKHIVLGSPGAPYCWHGRCNCSLWSTGVHCVDGSLNTCCCSIIQLVSSCICLLRQWFHQCP